MNVADPDLARVAFVSVFPPKTLVELETFFPALVVVYSLCQNIVFVLFSLVSATCTAIPATVLFEWFMTS